MFYMGWQKRLGLALFVCLCTLLVAYWAVE